jgi:1-aminocyclopropane-1-carboxylate deaminase
VIYDETPVIEVTGVTALEKAGVRLLIKREDQNHPFVSGNKWWKLRYNLDAANAAGLPVLTFGGAWSNHIYATAAAASARGLKSIGVIRGEEVLPLNTTLAFAKRMGMQLQFVDRSLYRQKESDDFQSALRSRFGDFFMIPEGGTNRLAVRGCSEFAKEHLDKIPFDRLVLPVGTGGTMAGIIAGMEGRKFVSGIAVLKGGSFLVDTVSSLLNDFAGKTFGNWEILTDHHLGGYAKTTPEQIALIREMHTLHQLPLDHVYTSKAFMAILDEAKKGNIRRGETVLLLHTGGLQGSRHLIAS